MENEASFNVLIIWSSWVKKNSYVNVGQDKYSINKYPNGHDQTERKKSTEKFKIHKHRKEMEWKDRNNNNRENEGHNPADISKRYRKKILQFK